MDNIFCNSCGSPNENGSAFCGSCGAKLPDFNQTPPPPPPNTYSQIPNVNTPNPNASYMNTPMPGVPYGSTPNPSINTPNPSMSYGSIPNQSAPYMNTSSPNVPYGNTPNQGYNQSFGQDYNSGMYTPNSGMNTPYQNMGPNTYGKQKSSSKWMILSIVFMIISLLFLPPIFGGLAIFFGYKTKQTNARTSSILMGAAVICMLIGMAIGAAVF